MRLYEDQPSGTIQQLRELRRNATEAEKKLRRALREAVPHLKWRFQTPVGPYRVDFLCLSEQLIIEVDGGQHDEQRRYDQRRTRFLESQGFRMFRFWNNDVLANTDGVIVDLSLSQREREEAAQRRKGEGDAIKKKGEQPDSHARSPFPPLTRRAPSLSHWEREL